ncbi:MAG: hypothetical protein HYV42_01535 [Candidatus Magasanikbacteria bacterium]|nr:hypothetical protein [Candidatus Magasanikbacteria bacterium]
MFAEHHANRQIGFASSAKWQHPNVLSYEQQKDITIIRQIAEELLSYEITSAVPNQPRRILGNHLTEELWGCYYAPRLSAAKQGDSRLFPAFFPGHTVPGPGANVNTRIVGTLAYARFEKLLKLGGGFPNIGPFEKDDVIEHATVDADQIGEWPWRYVEQPKLRIIHPARFNGEVAKGDMVRLKRWIEEYIRQCLEAGRMREALTLIRRSWSPHTKEPTWAPETIEAGKILFQWAMASDSLLACAFEIESILSHIQYSWPMNISGYGEYNGSWVEVGRLPITAIRCTELAVTKRVLHELANVRTKGFAPIIVNEYGCDTDGTHRLVGSWTWNLLGVLVGVGVDLMSEEVQHRVGAFIKEHRTEMGEIVVHEVLRSLAEILHDQQTEQELKRSVLPYVVGYYPITHLPVLLLPEYSCGAVIKGPYDDGVASYRVDPTVYEEMARDSSLTLPARGPYHLTDRALLPWFQILERR